MGKPFKSANGPGCGRPGERYRTGERVFLFLYPASKLGLTSPVAGATGRWAVRRDDKVDTNTADTRVRKSDLNCRLVQGHGTLSALTSQTDAGGNASVSLQLSSFSAPLQLNVCVGPANSLCQVFTAVGCGNLFAATAAGLG